MRPEFQPTLSVNGIYPHLKWCEDCFFPRNERTQIYATEVTYHREVHKIFPDLGGYPQPLTGP
eukprot:1494838-Karenia_brevis.AAC.1